MPYAIIMLLLFFIASPCAAAPAKSVTFYADGAVVEINAIAVKGIAEIALPPGTAEGSLRIRPMENTTIRRVDLLHGRPDAKRQKEQDALLEQKQRLEDRLKALDTKEEIFRAAAKSQSAKAPRKSKSNPDPIKSIRQGTEFAIAQLESVYTARRKCRQELGRVGARLAEIRRQGSISETIARVAVAPKNGRIRAHFVLAGVGWTPLYDIRLSGIGTAELSLSAGLPNLFKGYTQWAANGTLAQSAALKPVAAGHTSVVKLADHRLPSAEELFPSGATAGFSCLLTNSTANHLPAGEATIFYKGEYRDKLRFEGISSARSRKLTKGRW
ncbi:MAG TPA: hypothetical protein PL053_10205 [Deltaproteobacteria bacterium]|nr:hypothetical protein [Deltaproteobacteria bacterium]